METKNRIKPSFFLFPPQDETTVYCPDCGYVMEKILHTPKDKKPIYQCSRCNKIFPEPVYGLLDLK